MESAIDSKVARYRGNALVSQLVPKMKEQYPKRFLILLTGAIGEGEARVYAAVRVNCLSGFKQNLWVIFRDR